MGGDGSDDILLGMKRANMCDGIRIAIAAVLMPTLGMVVIVGCNKAEVCMILVVM